jgi:hypothetical protein
MRLFRQKQRNTRASSLVSGVLLALAITALHAGEAGNGFKISVTLNGSSAPGTTVTPLPGANSAFCVSRDNNKGALGTNVIVVCSTGQAIQLAPSAAENPFQPIHGGANRYITDLTEYGSYSGSVDGYISTGTVASWRQVSFTDRDYMELLVAW